MKFTSLKFLNLFTLFFLLACQNQSDKSKNAESTETIIRIKGSDTELLMVQHLAKVYMADHPNVNILVEGGGSNKGIEALMHGEIDICNSSKEISQRELLKFNSKKNIPIPLMFSVDALAIITNYKVGVDSLSTTQLIKIYNGEIKNWKDLGGEDQVIALFGRDKTSGTRDYFNGKFLSGRNHDSIKECSSNREIVNSVIETPGAIGYVGAGFLYDEKGKPNGKLWVMPIYIQNYRAYSAYESAVIKKGDYILSRPLYQYLNGLPSPVIEDFLLFELTKRGQDIIMEHGFYPINDYQKEINTIKGIY